MSTFSQESLTRKPSPWRRRLVAGLAIVGVLLVASSAWLIARASQPREAPEAEAVLSVQSTMPFQVLIPAYLPAGFAREEVEIQADQPGPQGEPMVRLVYTHRKGIEVAISEWIPQSADAENPALMCGATGTGQASMCVCNCMCSTGVAGSSAANTGLMTNVGPLRVRAETSHPAIVTRDLLGAILLTLAPASGLEVTTSLEEVASTFALPPAVEIPPNAEGVQEVVLVVSQSGYSPVHFAVRSGAPVRVIFKQLGYVGCGNELIMRWGPGEEGYLILASASDQQVLEFTPQAPGDFGFNCPHGIYQGVMTVQK